LHHASPGKYHEAGGRRNRPKDAGWGQLERGNNKHVDVGYKVTGMLFVAKAVFKIGCMEYEKRRPPISGSPLFLRSKAEHKLC